MARAVSAARRLPFLASSAAALLACTLTDTSPPRGEPVVVLPSASLAPAAARPISPLTVRIDTLSAASSGQTGPGSFRYRVEVPQLEGPAFRGKAVDAAIRSRLQHDVDEFLDTARDGPSGPASSDLSCISRTVRVTSRLAVLRVDCNEHRAGAARPNAFTHTFNCDLAAARLLALQDLFRPGAVYLGVLSTAARKQLRAGVRSADERALEADTAPVVDNFRAFLLDRGALVIVFAKYRLTPDATGQPEVSISYEDLQRYLAPRVKDLLDG